MRGLVAALSLFAGVMRWLVIVITITLTTSTAQARDDGQWADQPPAVRQWFRGLMQPDQPQISCCGEADAYEADVFEVEGDHYVAIITNGAGDPEHGKREIENGTRVPVPNSKMKWDEGNPTGHGILFVGPLGQVYCYVAPGGV